MKKLYLLLAFIFITNSYTFSWDSTAAKYYPLAVGNVWVYSSYYMQWGNTYFAGYHKHIVLNDSAFNGHKYYLVEPIINGCNNVKYERIDSNSMNVYRWMQNENREIFIDSLLSKKYNNFKGYRNCTNINNIPVICSDTGFKYVLNTQVKSKTFIADGLIFMNYILSENIGISFYSNSEGNSWWSSLNGCVINGVLYGDTNSIVGLNQIDLENPARFILSQNYPNPFNPVTNIKFQIPEAGLIKLIVYDILGNEVQVLVNKELSPGTYTIDFNGNDLPSGIYYILLNAGSFTETKKMVLMK